MTWTAQALQTGWIPWWLFAMLALATLAVTVALYRRDRRTLSAAQGWTLTCLRCATALPLLLLLADPALLVSVTSSETRKLRLIIDDSASLASAQSAGSEVSRIAASKSALRAKLETWSQRFEIETLRLSSGEATDLDSIDAKATATDLSSIADHSLQDGVMILVSDGGHSAKSNPLEASATLLASNTRLISVGVGPQERIADLALESVEAPPALLQGDEIELNLTLRVSGLSLETVTGEVLLDGAESLARFELDLDGSSGVSTWPIAFTADFTGRHRLDVRLDAPPNDTLEESDSKSTWVHVGVSALRVLLLDQSPRWEFRYLEATWDRDPNVDLNAQFPSPPPEHLWDEAFPSTADELFDYDLIVLGNVDASLIDEAMRQALADFVTQRGGTLTLLCGHRQPETWRDSALSRVLPIELPERFVDPQSAGSNGNLSPLQLTALGENYWPLRLLTGRGSNSQLWRNLPPPSWIYPASAIGEGSEVLAELELIAGTRTPVITTRNIGAGKVLYIGTDSTWRWRYHFGDRFPERFWRQIARWAINERLGPSDGFLRIGTDRDTYGVGDEVRIDVKLDTEPAKPTWIDAIVRTQAKPEQQSRIRLRAIPRSGGRYRGFVESSALAALVPTAQSEESFLIQIEADDPAYSKVEEKATSRFIVDFTDAEDKRQDVCDRELLESMATATGGGFTSLEELDKIESWLPQDALTRTEIEERRLFDHPSFVLTVLLALFAIEWILRKRWKLL